MTASGASDTPVPGYLGRVLYVDGAPAGTCFQVSAGVLVTACHVLDEVGAASEDALVRVDPLGGGQPFDAVVARLDPLRDLAVLTTHAQLPGVAGELTPTGQIPLRTEVNVTGHVVIDDPGYVYRFLAAAGEWAGRTMRDDAVPLGRMTSSGVMPGMSGAPVIRASDGAVAGVVSGRYNTADGWLAGTVWVARTEDLLPLLDGVADVGFWQPPLAGAVDVLPTVTAATMRKQPGHAFISYVREDSQAVDNLQHTLEAAGIRVWRDTADLWPGEDWRAKIRHAITTDAFVFIACFSRNSLARETSYQNEELVLAIGQLRLRRPDVPWLIPVRFDDCDIPDLDIGAGRTLTSLQRADLFGDHSNTAAERLITTVVRILRAAIQQCTFSWFWDIVDA